MLKKSLFYTLLFLMLLNAEEEYKDVEVYANNIEQNATTALIKGGVFVAYDGKVLTAKKGFYNIENKILTLKEDVVLIDNSGKRVNAQELEVNLANNHIKFHNFFEIDNDGIWLGALKASKIEDSINLTNAIFSSCEIENPDWKITFSKAKYDLKSKELKLDDASIYIKDFPVFYTPYLFLPLSKERRSGLLVPTLSYSNDDGFVYSQPYFWAISKSQDLEIVPQLRTSRGYGIFSTYRFVDTKYSKGKIKVGYFKDKDSFTEENSLRYNEHYGVEFYYKNNQVSDYLANLGYESKFYLNGVFFNDTEYFGLQLDDKIKHHKIGSFYESRANFYIKNNYFLTGIYFKYFKDTTQVSNKETLQTLPKFQYHIPYTNIFNNNIAISADLSATNYTRESGSKALKLKAPIKCTFRV